MFDSSGHLTRTANICESRGGLRAIIRRASRAKTKTRRCVSHSYALTNIPSARPTETEKDRSGAPDLMRKSFCDCWPTSNNQLSGQRGVYYYTISKRREYQWGVALENCFFHSPRASKYTCVCVRPTSRFALATSTCNTSFRTYLFWVCCGTLYTKRVIFTFRCLKLKL